MQLRPQPARQLPRRLDRLTLSLAPLTLAALTACGGSSLADVDASKLLQEGKIDDAIEAVEAQVASVEKGTEDERDITLGYVEILSYREPKKAATRFLDFAGSNAALATVREYKTAIVHLRSQDAFSEAVRVLSAAAERWPDDASIRTLNDQLKADIEASNDPNAAKALAGLPYG